MASAAASSASQHEPDGPAAVGVGHGRRAADSTLLFLSAAHTDAGTRTGDNTVGRLADDVMCGGWVALPNRTIFHGDTSTAARVVIPIYWVARAGREQNWDAARRYQCLYAFQ